MNDITYVQSNGIIPTISFLICKVSRGIAFEKDGTYWNYPAPVYFTGFKLEFMS